MNTIQITHLPPLEYVAEEAMNTLCTNLAYSGPDNHVIMITSRYAREGKSFVAMNLMRSLAKLGRRVVLVDTDLRASGIQGHFGLRFPQGKRQGLSDYLAGHCDLQDAIYLTNIENAWVMPAGHDAPNPLQLLDTERMEELLCMLTQEFDIVLVDTPPAGILVDAIALAKFCDGALIVVSYRRGRRREIGEVVRNLNKTGCKVLGAVLNNVNFQSFSNRSYYYRSERYASYTSKRNSYHYGYMKEKDE